MPNDPRLQCKAKFGNRIAEAHVRKAAERQLLGGNDEVVQILEHPRRLVGIEREHDQPGIAMACSRGAGKDAALSRAIGGRYCDKRCTRAVGACRRRLDLIFPGPILRHRERKIPALVHQRLSYALLPSAAPMPPTTRSVGHRSGTTTRIISSPTQPQFTFPQSDKMGKGAAPESPDREEATTYNPTFA